MKGFKDFVLRGNLVELAVAFIIGAAFATVVKAFTDFVLEAIGKVTGGAEFNFDTGSRVAASTVGPFLTALIAFLIMAVRSSTSSSSSPTRSAKERMFPAEPEADTIDPNTELLTEIRDALRAPRA